MINNFYETVERLSLDCEELYGKDSCYYDPETECIYIGVEGFLFCIVDVSGTGKVSLRFRASLTPEPSAILMRIICKAFGIDNVLVGRLWEKDEKGELIEGNMAVYYTACNIFEFWFGTKSKKEAKEIAINLDKDGKTFELELENSEKANKNADLH